jgi:hypothetical protein
MHQHGGNRAVDAARQAEHNFALLADQVLDRLHLAFGEVARIPIVVARGNAEHEVLEDALAIDGVVHFRMELQTKQLALAVTDHRKRARFTPGQDLETRAELLYLVPVRHPDDAILPHTIEQIAGVDRLQFRAAILGAALRCEHFTASVLGQPLQAVANTEHGNTLFEDRRIERRRVVGVN